MATRFESAITRSGSRSTKSAALLAFIGALSLPVIAAGQGVPPWIAAKAPIDDEGTKSVLVRSRDEPLFTLPSSHSQRRGAAAKGARLPFYGKAPGPGCRNDWLLVGPTAWMCGDRADLSRDPALSADVDPPSSNDGLPRSYYFVGPDGAFGYDELRSAEETKPVSSLEPGFSIAALQIANRVSGDPFALTTKGIWIPLRDLRLARPLTFRGYEVSDGKLDRAWVVADEAHLYEKPNGRRLGGAVKRRFETISVLEVQSAKQRNWVRTGANEWLDAADVALPRPSARPPEARAGERWIDVDLGSQVLTAYEGDVPVFATLVSTGKGRVDTPTATPPGTNRVWVKLRTTDMKNLEDEEASRYYAIEDVPWVMFFHNGVGLHGAFWHRSFGHVRSHGCVNLTPLDAERLFRWAGPHLPAGWTAALPTDYDPGTLVRVR
jgi:hypothetical protein